MDARPLLICASTYILRVASLLGDRFVMMYLHYETRYSILLIAYIWVKIMCTCCTVYCPLTQYLNFFVPIGETRFLTPRMMKPPLLLLLKHFFICNELHVVLKIYCLFCKRKKNISIKRKIGTT